MTSISDRSRRGFTLVELLVVVGMIGVIAGAMTTSVSAAQERARIQKATAEVKVISQAILAAENFEGELPSLSDADADESSLGFLIGKGGSDSTGDKIPALLMASLSSGGKMRDPWGTPYKIKISRGSASISFDAATSSMSTGYFIPNWYRLGPEERK